MAFTVKLIQALPLSIESAVKTYLDAQTITTMHSITAFHTGMLITVLIIFE